MPEGATTKNPAHARGRSLVRRIYLPRILGLGLGMVCVGAGLHQHGTPPWAWALLAVNGFIWPHAAHFWALRSGSPYRAELRNLVIDAAWGGFWVPAMGFNLLPSVLILTMLGLDNLAVGGGRLFLKGLLAHLAGGAIAVLALGVSFEPASNLTTLVACIPFLVTYPLVIGFVTYRLAQQLSRQKQDLRRLSEQDAMSGLYSRSHWEKRLSEEFHGFRLHGRGVALMLVDVDRFKAINDRYGHAMGDEVIRCVGRVLREHVRLGDVVGRYGGDEFGVIFPGASAAMARQVALRIRSALGRSEALASIGVAVTLSIGIAALLEEMASCDQWIECADRALYRVKHQGRDGISVYGEDEPEQARRAGA